MKDKLDSNSGDRMEECDSQGESINKGIREGKTDREMVELV